MELLEAMGQGTWHGENLSLRTTWRDLATLLDQLVVVIFAGMTCPNGSPQGTIRFKMKGHWPQHRLAVVELRS